MIYNFYPKTMKNFIKILIFSLLAITTYAQQATEIDSKSVKLPRYSDLTAIQTAITSPQQGMMVYNVGTNTSWNFDGTNWLENESERHYNNFQVFENTGLGLIQMFTVPVGVKKLMVSMWGGGGKGLQFGGPGNSRSGAGGGGGGYVKAVLDVSPGQQLKLIVGTGATLVNAQISGSNSVIELSLSNQIHAGGGGNAAGISSSMTVGIGGIYLIPVGINTAIGMQGQAGKPTVRHWEQSSATMFTEISEYGDGGDAANTTKTGGKGPYNATNATDGFIRAETQGNGKGIVPGGGGSAFNVGTDGDGANGRIILYW